MPTGRCVEFNGLAETTSSLFQTAKLLAGADRPAPRIVEMETPMLSLHKNQVKN
jgi:hypothetical protein